MIIPCKDCLILPICKATYNDYNTTNKRFIKATPGNIINPLPPIPLIRKCKLIRYYMYRVDRESDQRELVPRNNGININNIHIFYKELL